MRPERAIGADDLHVFVFQQRGHRGGTQVAKNRAFFGERKLRDDGQARKGTDRVDGENNFLDVRKSFQDVEIDAALFESQGLLAKNRQDFVGLRMSRLYADAERADGTCNQYLACGRVARLAGDFYAASVEPLDFVAQAERFEFETIGAEGVGLDDLRAGFDVGLMHAKDCFRLGGI